MLKRRPVRSCRSSQAVYALLETRAVLDAAFASGTQLLTVSHTGALETLRFSDSVSALRALNELRASGQFQTVEFDQKVSVSLIPNDPSYGSLWGMQNTGQNAGTIEADIDANDVWDIATGSAKVVVGVIDTGIDYRHQDLYKNIWINQEEIPSNVRSQLIDVDGDSLITFWDLNDPINIGPGKVTDLNGTSFIDGGDLLFTVAAGGWADGIDQDPYTIGATEYSRIDDLVGWDFVSNTNNPLDDHNHGTHVAGTIGALGDNGIGVVGVNWKVQMAAIKFLGAGGSGTIANATLALDYATANGIKLTNNSWGGGGISTAFSDALTRARDAGSLFIAAAGNSSVNTDVSPHYPSSYPHDNVISVASSTRTDTRSSFSNYGFTTVDLAAPGSDIFSTTRNNTYSTFSGTSMATPHVAGTIALLWGLEESLSISEIRSRILSTVDVLPNWSGVVASEGRLNAFRVINNSSPRPTVTILATDPNASESVSGIDPGTFTLTRAGDITSDLVVFFAIGGSATNGVDYQSIVASATIPAGESSATVTINPINDLVGDGSETVVLTLVSNSAYIRGSEFSATVTIVDDESVVTITASDANAAESESRANLGVFTVVRSGLVTSDLTVNFTLSGTATNGSDYTRVPNFVRIPAGQTSALVRIRPIDDQLGESSETVTLTLAANSAYWVGNPNSASVTILDNEPLVSITASDAVGAEVEGGSNSAAFTITRAGGSTTKALTVSYSVSGTAGNGDDYEFLPTSITIPAGATSVTTLINPVDDLVAEATETVILTLTGNSGYRVDSPSTASATILDNEAAISITATDASAAELESGEDPATFTITRNGGTTLPLTVTFSVTGTAVQGEDYESLPTAVTIPAGQASVVVTIRPIDDLLGETTESVIVTITPNSAYKIVGNGAATASILDNEPTVTIEATEDTAREDEDGTGDNPGVFTITRTGTLATNLTVSFSIAGTATHGIDYSFIPNTILIPAGQAFSTITIAPIDDLLVEDVETVILTLAADSAYRIGSPGSAFLEIRDNDLPPSFFPNPTDPKEPTWPMEMPLSAMSGISKSFDASVWGELQFATSYLTLEDFQNSKNAIQFGAVNPFPKRNGSRLSGNDIDLSGRDSNNGNWLAVHATRSEQAKLEAEGKTSASELLDITFQHLPDFDQF